MSLYNDLINKKESLALIGLGYVGRTARTRAGSDPG